MEDFEFVVFGAGSVTCVGVDIDIDVVAVAVDANVEAEIDNAVNFVVVSVNMIPGVTINILIYYIIQ